MRDSNEEAATEGGRDGSPVTPSPDAVAVLDANDEPAAGRRTRSLVVVAAWAVAMAALAAFLGFGSVTLEAGSRPGRSQRVVEVWRRFLDDLPEGGNTTLLRVVVFGLIAAVLVGSALGCWLAMTAADDRASRPLAGDVGGA